MSHITVSIEIDFLKCEEREKWHSMCIVKKSIYLKYDLFQNILDSLTSVWIQPPLPFFIFNCCTMQYLLDFKNVLVGMSSTM